MGHVKVEGDFLRYFAENAAFYNYLPICNCTY